MADGDDTLIVPVNVDALVVNQSVRQRDGQGFRRWRPNYNLLRHNKTPEPSPFTNEQHWNSTGTDDTPYKKYDGVYVRWELPEALRHGESRSEGGPTEFPLVPNRWLVVRQVRGHAGLTTAWVVESDFLDDRAGTSAFVHPFRPGVQDPKATPYRSTVITTKIGRAQGIGPDGGVAWSEPAAGDPARRELFLTAVGPGLMTFHIYQPYHQNVFSLHDPMTGVPDRATVDYQVVGWHSDPAQEELRRRLGQPGTTVAGVLAELGWKVAGLPQGWTPASTSCCGRAVGVGWDRTGKAPDSARPADKNTIKVGVGSSVDEATAALLAAARNALGHADPGLLHALGQGLVDTLDGPDGTVRTAQAMHKGWFEQLPGGYVWRLADTSGQGTVSGDPSSVTWSGVSAEHEEWLARLNRDQAAYDTKARELAALQWRLYALWWMHGLPLLPLQYTREQFRAEIDPTNPDGLAAEVARRIEELKELQDRVPHGAGAVDLARSIAAYLDSHPPRLPDGYELRQEALPPFWQASDPTVVLSGAKSQDAHDPLTGGGPLTCRTPAQILGGVAPGGPIPDAFAVLKTGGLPPIVAALLGEFVHVLDPDHTGTLPPDIAPEPWRQPWKPLLYQWRVRHWPVPYGDPDRPNWRFDGSRYAWERGDATKPPLEITGRRFLVPLPQYTLSSGLDQYAADHPAAAAAAFASAAEQAKDLDLLSQRLDGLTDALACVDAAPNLSPPGAVGRLVGDVFGRLPDPGPLPVPFDGWQKSGFTQIRAGQFAMSTLSIVDEFGQTLDVLLPGDASYLEPHIGDSLRPGDRYAEDTLKRRFVQLPPRLLQPARLRFDFLAEHDDDQLVDLTANTTPVCAWIIPSYVDRSLLCYAPTGAPLGELRLKLQADAGGEGGVSTAVGWGPLPDSQVHTIDGLLPDRPQLHAFVSHLAAAGPAVFLDLLSTVDRALSGIDPGNPYGDEVLGALLGRPLALVRTGLGFELDGPPVTDPGWQHALDWRALTDWRERKAGGGGRAPAEMDHLNYRWPIRLGNAGQSGDGLIGYFPESDYTTFYAVTGPGTEHPTSYVREISSGNWPTLAADSMDRTHLTVLLDPLAAVHATTDLLPVTDLRLPNRFTRTAMAAMKVALRLSPVLTTTRRVPAKQTETDGKSATKGESDQPSGFVNALALPHPTSPQGVWDWSELVIPDTVAGSGATAAPQWAHHAVVQIDQNARLDEDGPVVRTGFLRLTNGFDHA
ncbi:hypothetical protein [Streptomyces sp. NPDC050355]|uniref:hypothetical protein n=1 Tax=Streptomyces sp. NPDC050355 TaxID=3365609 RepID=UPI0037ACA80E